MAARAPRPADVMATSDDHRLSELLALVLEVADGNYAARINPSDAGDSIDAAAVGINLMAESLELERDRRRRAEAMLRDEVRAYEEAPAMFCSVEPENFVIVKCNETMAKALGVKKDKLLERRLVGFLPVHEREQAARSLEAIARGEPAEQTTFHLRGKGGRPIPVLVSGSPLEAKGTRFRLVLRDVTREHMLASRLRESQKLEVVGRLASGVSHDFNNLLQVIMGAASLLKKGLDDDHDGQREIEAIVEAADLGTGLTRQLLALSRPLPRRKAPVSSLNGTVREIEPLLRRTLGAANRLELHLHADELPMRVEPGELTQVLINLAVNARDAMPRDGLLTIRTSTADNGYVLEVVDNGVGIAPDIVEHVVEPFVTTKSESGGTGLGLAVCKRITESWGGTLTIRSDVGVGTTVELTLPPAEAHDASGAEVETASKKPFSSKRLVTRVLVVDDEPLVRHLTARALERVCEEVLTAESMSVALDTVRGAGKVDLVITDVVMPDGSGVDLARELWRDRPDLPVIFVSGYTGDAVDPGVLARPHVRFLAKPFRDTQLLEIVDVLRAREAPESGGFQKTGAL